MDLSTKDLYLYKKRCLLILLFLYYGEGIDYHHLLLRSFGFQFDPSCDYKVVITGDNGEAIVKQAIHVFNEKVDLDIFDKENNVNFFFHADLSSPLPFPNRSFNIYFDGLNYACKGYFLGKKHDDEVTSFQIEKARMDQFNTYLKQDISFTLWLLKFYCTHLKTDLVMGAGINKDYGAKDWQELISALSEKSYDGGKSSFSQTKHYVGDDLFTPPSLFKTQGFNTYQSLVHELYEFETAKDFSDPSSTLYRCVEFIEHHPGINVITYNYDTNLEYLLKKKSLLYCSTYDDSSFSAEEAVATIYHVHGLLPYGGAEQKRFTSSLIFNESDYYYLYNNPYSWNVAKQLHDFKFNTCLFIGISLKDPDMKRLLELARNPLKFNFIFLKREKGYREKVFADISSYFFTFDLILIWVDEYSQIGEILACI